jgi:hypothetical protein
MSHMMPSVLLAHRPSTSCPLHKYDLYINTIYVSDVNVHLHGTRYCARPLLLACGVLETHWVAFQTKPH